MNALPARRDAHRNRRMVGGRAVAAAHTPRECGIRRRRMQRGTAARRACEMAVAARSSAVRMGRCDARSRAEIFARARRDVVVDRHQRAVGPPHGPARLLQALKGLRRRHLVHQVAVNVEQSGATGHVRARAVDEVCVPDLRAHRWSSERSETELRTEVVISGRTLSYRVRGRDAAEAA
jgi:hypothetical protein